jgi:RNase P/RNase MRP subunit POP5
VFEVVSQESLGVHQVEDAIQHACRAFKDKGLRFVHDTWDSASKQGIVRVFHTHARQLCDALATIKNITNIRVTVKTLGMSGILRQAKIKFMKNKSIRKENKRNYHHRL